MKFKAKMKPILSIVIATYKRPAYLRHLLESIIDQLADLEYQALEVVVVDNGLDSETKALMDAIVLENQVFRYFRRAKSVSMEKSIMSVLEYGTGHYLWALGDDDALEPGSIKYLIDYLLECNPTMVLVHHDAWSSNMESKIGSMHGHIKIERSQYKSLLGAVQELGWGVYFAYLGASVFKPEKFRANDIRPYEKSPHVFSLCMLEAFHAEPCEYLIKPLIRYRVNNILPYSDNNLKVVTIVFLKCFEHLQSIGVGSMRAFLSMKDYIAADHKLVHLKIHSLAACLLSNQWDRIVAKHPVDGVEWKNFRQAYEEFGDPDMCLFVEKMEFFDHSSKQQFDDIELLRAKIFIKENLNIKNFPRKFLCRAEPEGRASAFEPALPE